MTPTPGSRLGPYEILAPLGAGGMGEIYRARDPRLGREVAIKGLPAAFLQDPERLARFDREAKLLASLNHPNIGMLYGLEETPDGARFLVLELLEGETLGKRLERGPLPVRETIELGMQIAAAIEAAHDRGIVHRDLKPANVMLTPGGVAKVLDFGLAKGDDGAAPDGGPASAPGSSVAPTQAISATAAGLVLGTAPYMSPEQARGAPVDRRTDVWAFGCVILECLTGRQAFAGPTISDVIARILEREPDWAAIPASAPARLRDLARRCLIKNPADRPRDIGDLRRELAAIQRDLSSGSFTSSSMAVPPSLAVLYFENLADDKESEYFCAGITEDILTDLSKIKGMRVASRNAVARYRGATVDVARVAADLGVGAVLEGSVRRSGDRIRISAQLISAVDGFHLWAERYDRSLQDVFSVQEEIAASIASALQVKLTPAETEHIVQNRPADARAYDLYLKGREAYGHYSVESLRRALELFREALAVDPGYALAWAGIADAHGQLVQWGSRQDRNENIRLGMEAVGRALSLAPHLPEVYKAKGLLLRFQGDYAGSTQALERAVEMNPAFTPALINLGVDAARRADLAKAERFMRRALEVDPREAFAGLWLALLALSTGRPRETLQTASRVREITDDPFYVTGVYDFRVSERIAQGDLEGAEQLMAEGRAEGAIPTHLQGHEALVAALRGRRNEARRLLDATGVDSLVGIQSLVSAAAAAWRIDDPEQGLRYLARDAVEDLMPVFTRLNPELHFYLDGPPFAPRRSELTLVWPLEAPMIDRARHALFKEVKIESGIPRPGGFAP